ncbi:MAG TPA: bifunctional DNA-formamidopyrimidine glycosylase/DNA-(apurinic or apyrimidinic site) lyase [Terriglobales bacterium]|jgi:formamidopyrimidine-DNA glycosylase|nr:bifunctional DNA-formamidopyrimidine glycosylase/DNA-(apurinic or apyrimidinic site) lyase [Terriglobales bacterium]
MPELPEVETIARGLASRVTGDVIESVWLGPKPEPLKSAAHEIVTTLESKRIASVRRVGKHIVFDLENGGRASSPVRRKSGRKSSKPEQTALPIAQWIVHLGMTGRMLVCKSEEAIEKHTHAVARLASGRELRFVDPRRFGRLSVAQGFAAAGSEPLDVSLDRFVELFRGRKTPIKSALLNQKLLSGVGNIYADESLFRAGIRPRRRASSLTRKELSRLYAAIQEVLKEAILAGGSSISNYVDADGEEGFFQLQHRVYGRKNEPCLVCKTPIKRIVIGGRSSHYCPKCQK